MYAAYGIDKNKIAWLQLLYPLQEHPDSLCWPLAIPLTPRINQAPRPQFIDKLNFTETTWTTTSPPSPLEDSNFELHWDNLHNQLISLSSLRLVGILKRQNSKHYMSYMFLLNTCNVSFLKIEKSKKVFLSKTERIIFITLHWFVRVTIIFCWWLIASLYTCPRTRPYPPLYHPTVLSVQVPPTWYTRQTSIAGTPHMIPHKDGTQIRRQTCNIWELGCPAPVTNSLQSSPSTEYLNWPHSSGIS